MTRARIGEPVHRKEDFRLVTGRGCFTDDVNLPGQAYAVMVRSPHAHARIGTIENAKIPSAASFNKRKNPYLVSPECRSDRSTGMPIWRNPTQLRIPRK